MTDAAEKLIEEALKLPESERRLLAVVLLDSVGEEPTEDVDRAWIAEARKRLQDVQSGAVKPVSWEEARRRIFARE